MIPKNLIGVAAEMAVASELCRRGIYAQLTFGNLKRVDLLIFHADEKSPLLIEVKSKQGSVWPNCKGISKDKSILIFVDFQYKNDLERPDFYILTVDDWKNYLKKIVEDNPHKEIKISSNNVLIWTKQIKNGKAYEGVAVDPKEISMHKEKWEKIVVGQGTEKEHD